MRTTAKLLLMMGSGVAALLPAASAQAAEATISNFSFSPNPVTIPLGATLRWTNADGVMHTVTADDGSFSSDNLSQDDKFSHTFNQPGPVAYHCKIHTNMRGTVQVEGATTTTAAPTTTTTASPTTSTTAAPTATTTKPTSPKPAVSSTTRATAAPTITTAAPVTTTAPPPSSTAPPMAAAPEEATASTEAALDVAPANDGSKGGAPIAGVAVVLLVLCGGAGWWALRRRSAGTGV